jgi:hypothetical protein
VWRNSIATLISQRPSWDRSTHQFNLTRREVFPSISLQRRRRRPEAAYSCRNVRMGSTFAARAAGIHAANRHAAMITSRLDA